MSEMRLKKINGIKRPLVVVGFLLSFGFVSVLKISSGYLIQACGSKVPYFAKEPILLGQFSV